MTWTVRIGTMTPTQWLPTVSERTNFPGSCFRHLIPGRLWTGASDNYAIGFNNLAAAHYGVPVLAHSPGDAQIPDTTDPTRTAWEGTVQSVVDTLNTDVVEVGNEPTWVSGGGTGFQNSGYWRCLRQASPIIRKAGMEVCLAAAEAHHINAFIQEAINQNVLSLVDSVALHPYGDLIFSGGNVDIAATVSSTMNKIASARNLIPDDWLDIHITEVGWGTTGTPTELVTNSANQGDLLTEMMNRFIDTQAELRRIRTVHWFIYRDGSPNTGNFAGFGLRTNGDNPKNSWNHMVAYAPTYGKATTNVTPAAVTNGHGTPTDQAVTLQSQINGRGHQTNFRFDYGTASGNYAAHSTVGDAGVGNPTGGTFSMRTGVMELPPTDPSAAVAPANCPAAAVRVLSQDSSEVNADAARSKQLYDVGGLWTVPCLKTHWTSSPPTGPDAQYNTWVTNYLNILDAGGTQRGDVFEIGNEPPQNQIDKMLRCLAGSYQTIRNSGRPVIIGCVTAQQGGVNLLLSKLNNPTSSTGNATLGMIDGFAIHIYADLPSSVLSAVQNQRALIPGSKFLAITENGWATNINWPYSPPITGAQQAAKLTQTAALLAPQAKLLNLRLWDWFAYDDFGDPTDWIRRCGLVDRFGTQKPSWAAMDAVARQTTWTLPLDLTRSLASLTPATTYYFRVTAFSEAGSTYGAENTFTTDAHPPVVTPQNATTVTQTTATLQATLNAQGQATTYHFEYGIGNYGTSTTTQSLAASFTDTAVSANLTGLTPNSSYQFRLVATNATGTTNGTQRTFSTSPSSNTAVTRDTTTGYNGSLASVKCFTGLPITSGQRTACVNWYSRTPDRNPPPAVESEAMIGNGVTAWIGAAFYLNSADRHRRTEILRIDDHNNPGTNPPNTASALSLVADGSANVFAPVLKLALTDAQGTSGVASWEVSFGNVPLNAWFAAEVGFKMSALQGTGWAEVWIDNVQRGSRIADRTVKLPSHVYRRIAAGLPVYVADTPNSSQATAWVDSGYFATNRRGIGGGGGGGGAVQHNLTVAYTGAGVGDVSGGGQNWPGTHPYDEGTVLYLTAAASGGSTFGGWSGDGTTLGDGRRQVTIPAANVSVTADFDVSAVVPVTWDRINDYEAGADFVIGNGDNEWRVAGPQDSGALSNTYDISRQFQAGRNCVRIITNGASPANFVDGACSCPRMKFEPVGYTEGDEFWFGGDFYFGAGVVLNDSRLLSFHGLAAGGEDAWLLTLDTDTNGLVRVAARARPAPPENILVAPTAIPRDQWVSYDVHIVFSKTNGNALTELYRNGTLIGTPNDTDWNWLPTGAPMTGFQGGFPFYDARNGAQTTYFDRPRIVKV